MNLFRMLTAVLRALHPHPTDAHIRALQSSFAREAAMQTGREGLDNVSVSAAELMRTRETWRRG